MFPFQLPFLCKFMGKLKFVQVKLFFSPAVFSLLYFQIQLPLLSFIRTTSFFFFEKQGPPFCPGQLVKDQDSPLSHEFVSSDVCHNVARCEQC
jgi:hypothetical protein